MGCNPLTRGNAQYVADFETATNKELLETHPVWAWAVASVDKETIVCTGTEISAFIEWCSTVGGSDIYFHNLKFDGEFITYYLLTHGYEYVENSQYKKGSAGKFFTSVISGQGSWYAIRVHFEAGLEVTFKDSLKRVPLKVGFIPKAYGLDVTKGDINHDIERPAGYIPTSQEWDYVKRDVLVVAKALNILDEQGMERVTVGSNAMFFYKSTMAHSDDYQEQRRAWYTRFPQLQEKYDRFCRASYLGGWVYANPKYQGELVGEGRVYDVNSMYPGVMRKYPFPYGRPVAVGPGRVSRRYFNNNYIYFQRATFKAVLRPGCPPTLKIRDSFRYYWNRYITNTSISPRTGEPCDPYVTATLSTVDWELLQTYYDIEVISYDGFVVFKAATGLFDDYIDYWTEQKIKAAETDNKGLRTIAKLYLNNLYGKFGSNPNRTDKSPHLVNGEVKYTTKNSSVLLTGYIPVACLVTAYARREVTQAAYNNFDRFLYADTDSIHLLGDYDPKGMDIHPYNLGAWDNEAVFTRAKYLGAKCYAEEINGDWKITVAGMPDECKQGLDVVKDFNIGFVGEGKLLPKRYPGGVVLEKTTFEIKER